MRIYSVTQVLAIPLSEKILLVTARGLTATSGWTNPRLTPIGEVKPIDGVLEFSFEADPPGGITTPVLTPIAAFHEVSHEAPINAVIVFARTNHITVHVSQFTRLDSLGAPAIAVGGGTTTAVIGEVGPTTEIAGEEEPSTEIGGESVTTSRFGQEHLTIPAVEHISTFALAFHEEATTLSIGEEPATTFIVGEETTTAPISIEEQHGGPLNPGGGGGPFGTF